jgi:hypothetical protein
MGGIMNVIVTAQVTYEMTDVADTAEAIQRFQDSLYRGSFDRLNKNYIGTKEMFITEMNRDGTFMESPQIWEIEEIA